MIRNGFSECQHFNVNFDSWLKTLGKTCILEVIVTMN